MFMSLHKFYPFLIVIILVYSCQGPKAENEEAATSTFKSVAYSPRVLIKTAKVRDGNFNLEIISNGKALAVKNADVKFPLNVEIEKIFVRNGAVVRKGQVLALLNNTDLRNKLNRNKEALEKAKVELDDRLIDFGYRLKDSVKIPAEIMRMAKVKSSYNSALYDYADARTALARARIIAPFSGRVANLEAREYNDSETFRKLCSLVDDSRMLVEFNVLEAEFVSINRGSSIDVIPYGSNQTIKGTVTAINPEIDENGMIKITGEVSNASGTLLNGMSVKVIAKKSVADKLYIPKEAVVQRQNRNVVFTYQKGLAKWNYVETGIENQKSITIESGLKAGQQVIISNNFNLAHDSEVEIDERKLAGN
jgi:RND family efflux transporter MFP subunit